MTSPLPFQRLILTRRRHLAEEIAIAATWICACACAWLAIAGALGLILVELFPK